MTVKGPVSLRWEREGTGFTAGISLPNGVAATFVPPLDPWRVKAITIDGQAAIGAYVEHARWHVPVEAGGRHVIAIAISV